MSNIKRHLWEEVYGEEPNSSGLTDMEEYELFCLYSKLKENMKTEEEVMDFFKPLWEEEV